MTGRHMWATLASVIVVGAGGAGVVLRSTPPPEAAAAARRGRLEVVVTESGVLRAASSVTFRSPVEGRELEIRWLAPEGSQVRAGELVATLDTSGLQVDLDRATQMARQVEMELAAARVEREEAALALRGATEGEILSHLTGAEMLEPRYNDLRDRIDLYYLNTNTERLKTLKSAARFFIKAIKKTTGIVLVPDLSLAFRKLPNSDLQKT